MNETPTIDHSYAVIRNNDYLTIRLIGDCSSQPCHELETLIREHLNETVPHIIVNCESVSSIPKDWTRYLLVLQSELKKGNKLLRLILVHPGLQSQFKKDGLDRAFVIKKTLHDALVELGLIHARKLDTDFINPFLQATMTVLKIQAGLDAVPQKIFLRDDSMVLSGDISGVIGIVSDAFNGSVVVSFPEKTFLKVMSSMLGEDYQTLSKEIIDGAGEIINMVFGQAKVTLNEKGYGIKTALPSVVTGKDHTLTSVTSGPHIIVPFKTSQGDFYIEICLSQ